MGNNFMGNKYSRAYPLVLLVSILVSLSQAAGAAPIRLSLSSTGAEADKGSHRPAISDDGRYVAFESNATNLVPGDTNHESDIFQVRNPFLP